MKGKFMYGVGGSAAAIPPPAGAWRQLVLILFPSPTLTRGWSMM
jgi:hypothetical protein